MVDHCNLGRGGGVPGGRSSEFWLRGNPDPEFHEVTTDALHRLLFPAICWIKAMASWATQGRPPRLRDLNPQNTHKPW